MAGGKSLWAVLFAVSVGLAIPGHATAGETVVVKMKDWQFQPQKVTVSVGDTVVWIHEDDEYDTHNVIFEDPSIGRSKRRMKVNQRFSLTFDRPGEYHYFCSYHKDNGMVGVVIVK